MNDLVDVAEEYGPALGDPGPEGPIDRRASDNEETALFASPTAADKRRTRRDDAWPSRHCECCAARKAKKAKKKAARNSPAAQTVASLAKMRDRPEWSPGLIARALSVGLGYAVGGNSYNSPNGFRVMLFVLMAILINEFTHALIKIRRKAYYSSLVRELETVAPEGEIAKGKSGGGGEGTTPERTHPELLRSELIGFDATLVFDLGRGGTEGSAAPFTTLIRQRKKNCGDGGDGRCPRDFSAVGLRLSNLASDIEVAEFAEKIYGWFEQFSVLLRYFTITAVTFAINEVLKQLFYGADAITGIVDVFMKIYVLNVVLETLTTTYFPHPQFHR